PVGETSEFQLCTHSAPNDSATAPSVENCIVPRSNPAASTDSGCTRFVLIASDQVDRVYSTSGSAKCAVLGWYSPPPMIARRSIPPRAAAYRAAGHHGPV